MVNWSITATTIYCEAVNDEVTIFVYKDGTFKCASERKYAPAGKETGKGKAPDKGTKRKSRCQGDICTRVKQYRDKLFEEENQLPE